MQLVRPVEVVRLLRQLVVVVAVEEEAVVPLKHFIHLEKDQHHETSQWDLRLPMMTVTILTVLG